MCSYVCVCAIVGGIRVRCEKEKTSSYMNEERGKPSSKKGLRGEAAFICVCIMLVLLLVRAVIKKTTHQASANKYIVSKCLCNLNVFV